jgi:outer membrane protein assembly factor BamA
VSFFLPTHRNAAQSFVCHRLFLTGAGMLMLLAATVGLRAQPATPTPQTTQQPTTATAPAAGQMRLVKVEFVGLERVKQAEALAASGLATGQDVDIAAIDAAGERLMQSGLFSNLGYSVKGTSAAATIVFKVEESKRGVPVVFDNFVWFSEEELREAVRRKVPSFEGVAPAGGAMTEAIKTALSELLRSRKIEGVVEYAPSTDAANRPEHLFTVKGAALRVCEVHYPGASSIPEKQLVENSSGIFNNDYSRTFVGNYVEAALLPLYRERGLLRATYRPPQVKVTSNAECESGVSVTVPIEEGIIYTYERAVWNGNHDLTVQELDAALGLKAGEVAGSKKLEKGVFEIGKAYGRKGHLTPRVRPVPDFDDANRRVAFRFEVDEGPLYRMGDLVITGLPEIETNNLRGRWRLLSKEVFDTGYMAEFLKTSVPEFYKDMLRAGQRLPPYKIEPEVKPDREKGTVDVTINFKPAPQTPTPKP